VSAPIPESNGSTGPIARVLDHLQGVHRSGAGWMARCPHHDDRQASLSVTEGADGRVLLHCHAGCATADVVTSAGLAWVDLFPPGSRERLKARTWLGLPMGPNGRPALVAFGDDSVAALLGEFARLSHVRGTLDTKTVDVLRVMGVAVGVNQTRLAVAMKAALATEGSS
jgi:hypothetical protein